MQASSVARGMMARLGIRSYPISLTFELTWLCISRARTATGIRRCGTR